VNQQAKVGGKLATSHNNLEIPHFMPRILLLLCLSILATGCTAPAAKKDDWDRMKVTTTPVRKNLVFGEGLDGRIENEVKVYKVVVALFVTKQGKVEHAEVARSDAPKRLQWAAVKAVRRFHFNPSPTPRIHHQVFVFKGVRVEPD
jgi:TonB family protein